MMMMWWGDDAVMCHGDTALWCSDWVLVTPAGAVSRVCITGGDSGDIDYYCWLYSLGRMWSGWQGTTGTTPAETPETPATGNLSGVWSVYYSIIHSLNNGLNFQLPSSFHKLGWCLCDWRRSSFLVMDGHPVTLLLCLSSSVLRHIDCFYLTFNGIAFGHTITPSKRPSHITTTILYCR